MVIKLYDTYALDEQMNDNTYAFTLYGDTSVSIPANSIKNIYYGIRNVNGGSVRYGVGYSSTSTVVRIYDNSIDSVQGLLTENATKMVRLQLKNIGDTSDTVVLSTILGYENGGNLIVPNGVLWLLK